MTVVLGYSDNKGNVHIAADSGSFTTYEKYVSEVEKVFFIGNDFLIGFAGSWRLGEILRYDFTPPARPDNIDDMTYLVSYFIDSIRNLFKEKGFSSVKDNQESTEDSLFLLGYRGKLYTIDNDYHINSFKDKSDSIGAGSYHCIAAWDALSHIKDIKKRMLKAIDIAEKRCTMVSKPYVYKVLKND